MRLSLTDNRDIFIITNFFKKNNMKNKVELKHDSNTNNSVLYINDKVIFCAYKSPILVPNQLGNFALMQHPCNQSCALFQLNERVISINCGCEKIIHKID